MCELTRLSDERRLCQLDFDLNYFILSNMDKEIVKLYDNIEELSKDQYHWIGENRTLILSSDLKRGFYDIKISFIRFNTTLGGYVAGPWRSSEKMEKWEWSFELMRLMLFLFLFIFTFCLLICVVFFLACCGFLCFVKIE